MKISAGETSKDLQLRQFIPKLSLKVPISIYVLCYYINFLIWQFFLANANFLPRSTVETH